MGRIRQRRFTGCKDGEDGEDTAGTFGVPDLGEAPGPVANDATPSAHV